MRIATILILTACLLAVSVVQAQPDITVSPDQMDFGTVMVNGLGGQALTISNEGDADLTVSDISVQGDYFRVEFDEEFVVEPEGSHRIRVLFAPEESGDCVGTLTVTSDDPDEGEVIVDIIGCGRSITVWPSSLNFGEVAVGGTAVRTFTIRNLGGNDLTITGISIEGEGFAWDVDRELEFVVRSEHPVDVFVTFNPDEDDDFEGTLIITSEGGGCDEVTVSLSGSAWDTADEFELAYDSGNPHGSFQGLGQDNLEGVCFTPAHPCSLLSVRFIATRQGELELHFWGDNGAHQPDQDNDLIEPIIVDVNSDRNWIEVDLSDAGLVFETPQDFHIGNAVRDGGPQLWVDDEEHAFQQRGHLWSYNNGLRQWLWHTFNGNYLVRVTLKYFEPSNNFTFVNISEEAGVGGLGFMAWADYDNDGWEDLLVRGRTLYHNHGDGTFEDVSIDAGITNNNPCYAAAWGDFDNDGWIDFYAVTNSYDADDQLWRNNGDGTFSMVNDDYALEHGGQPTAGCGWGDANNDGFLDIHIANSENWNDGNPIYYRDHYYQYDSDFGMYLDYTPPDIVNRNYYGRSVAWCDFDLDGDMDYYLSNYRLQPNFLFVNRGDLDGDEEVTRFEDEAARRGVRGYLSQGAYGHTIGSAWADFDNDGDFDLLVGNFAHPWGLPWQDKVMLCRNTGAPNYNFEDINLDEGAGIKFCETVYSPAWGDYDNDGWLDVFITACYDGRQPFLYHNNGDGESFDNTNYESGFHGNCYNSSAVTWCDYDHDGDLDLFVTGNGGGVYLNTGNDGDWVEFVLRGQSETVNKFAFGSQASVHIGERHYLRQVEGGTGAHAGQNMMALHYGLGNVHGNRIDSLVVNWMGGGIDRYYDIPCNMRWTVVEGEELIVAPMDPGEITQPSAFTLEAPYPNPFNNRVNITFSLSRSARVEMIVYDLTGRKVTTLTNTMYKTGEHRLTWDAAGMPAGSYLIQAVHKNGITTRMVTLVK